MDAFQECAAKLKSKVGSNDHGPTCATLKSLHEKAIAQVLSENRGARLEGFQKTFTRRFKIRLKPQGFEEVTFGLLVLPSL